MLGKGFIILFVMAIYVEELKKDLYTNIEKQISLGNKLLDYRKGTLVLKRRNGIEYYYLSYREKNKVKTDYLGKLTEKEINSITKEIEDGLKIKKNIKSLQEEEKEIRHLLKAINRKALVKDIYEVIDIIAIIRPILKAYSVNEAYLYGDYSLGNVDEYSSVDLAIDGANKSVSELKNKLEKELEKEVVVITPSTQLPVRELEQIEEEKILIYGGY